MQAARAAGRAVVAAAGGTVAGAVGGTVAGAAGAVGGAARSVAELAWPPACLSCRAALSERGVSLCASCQDGISRLAAEPYCRTCGDDAAPHMLIDGRCGKCRRKLTSHLRFNGYVRVGAYAGALRELVLGLKDSVIFASVLADHLAAAWCGARLGGLPDIDLVVPVPSHWWRRWQRGHHPARLLCEGMSQRTGLPVADALGVARYIPPLHRGMSPAQRAVVLRGVFKASDPSIVAGRTIGLVDDVMTTGATLSEARRVLKLAGAKAVCAIVVARYSWRRRQTTEQRAMAAPLASGAAACGAQASGRDGNASSGRNEQSAPPGAQARGVDPTLGEA